MSVDRDRFERVFVVIDPMRMVQPALIKGEWIASRDGAQLVVYCCIYEESLDGDKAAQQRELEQTRHWLDRLVAPAEAYGLDVVVKVEWDNLWREAIIAAAKDSESDIIVKTSSRHSVLGRRFLKTADWSLLSECACPILLVSDAHLWESKKLLAAIKLKPEDPAHEGLNGLILQASHNIAEHAGFELHAVTAYKGDEIFSDRQKFADTCRLPRDRVHWAEGVPQKAITKLAAEVGADIIVVGNAGRSFNETAQRLIDEVSADVLVLPPPENLRAA